MRKILSLNPIIGLLLTSYLSTFFSQRQPKDDSYIKDLSIEYDKFFLGGLGL
tara:strand:- start:617 stop:772 length:156 start_codon:yes stop_codon:yes gene_type:complete